MLTWSAVDGADAYYLYVMDSNGEERLIGGSADRTHVVDPDTVAIRLHAVDGTTEGLPAEITVPLPEPPPPTESGEGSGEESGRPTPTPTPTP